MRRLLPCLLVTSACGGASDPNAHKTVFDPTAAAAKPAPVALEAANQGTPAPTVETSYPPLDRADPKGGPGWTGVSVLRGGVRFSRPSNWSVRDASVDPGHAFILYVSPSAYSFAIYERSDGPTDAWKDVQGRYEAQVAAAGAKVAGLHIPVATGFNQGRAYTIDRSAPLPSRSREYLFRSEHRVVLVQVVSQETGLSRFGGELVDILGHLEVL
jgi:hypothetical protein